MTEVREIRFRSDCMSPLLLSLKAIEAMSSEAIDLKIAELERLALTYGRKLFEDRIGQLKHYRANPVKTEVYFVRVGAQVKIGTARNVAKRLRELQIANAENLELLGSLSGGKGLETELHIRFSRYHIRGEWFEQRGHLNRFIVKNFGKPLP